MEVKVIICSEYGADPSPHIHLSVCFLGIGLADSLKSRIEPVGFIVAQQRLNIVKPLVFPPDFVLAIWSNYNLKVFYDFAGPLVLVHCQDVAAHAEAVSCQVAVSTMLPQPSLSFLS